MRTFAISALVAAASALKCSRTDCDLVTVSTGYKIIRVTHPVSTDPETVCDDGQDYSKGKQDVEHTPAVTKHCAMINAVDCECHQAGTHPTNPLPATVENGSRANPTNPYPADSKASHAKRDDIEAALDAHKAIDAISTPVADYTTAAHTRDGTSYAAHDGHVH